MPVKTTTDQRPDYWSETKINQTKINNPVMQNRYYSEKKVSHLSRTRQYKYDWQKKCCFCLELLFLKLKDFSNKADPFQY